MKLARKIGVVRGAPILRLPGDAGFTIGKTYRITYDGNTVEIKGPCVREKKYIHETVVYGKATVDRTVFAGTKDGPTIRLLKTVPAGQYEVEYSPTERNLKMVIDKPKEA